MYFHFSAGENFQRYSQDLDKLMMDKLVFESEHKFQDPTF